MVKVVDWLGKWGFNKPVERSKYVIFSNKRKIENKGLVMYGKPLERVKEFKLLGVYYALPCWEHMGCRQRHS